MSERSTRRQLLARGAAAGAALAVPSLMAAQTPTPPPPTVSTEEAERPLAKLLPENAKKLLKPALEANATNAVQRLKHPLPENSEPCFAFKAEPREVRKR